MWVAGLEAVQRMKADRGPRHMVIGTIRPREFRVVYATSAEQAEQQAAEMETDRLRQVRIVAPATVEADHADVLRQSGKAWRAAMDSEVDRRQQLAAAVVTAVQAGMSESEAARLAGVSRMTVRSWLGKS